jgi:hypothetical protein
LIRSARLRAAACAVFLLLLNLWIAKELLLHEYVNQMGSIEGTHISISRWVLENWRDLTWFPVWYGGIPYQNSYPPLHHWLTAALAGLTGFSPARSYHAVTGLFYAAGPVTLFLLARRLSSSTPYGFGAGLMYSLVSPSIWLMRTIREGASSLWQPRRLQVLIQYGEGPHIASVTLLPLALLLLIVAFERRRPVWWLLAAAGLASVVLTNWLGGLALAVAVACWLLTSESGAWWTRWLTASLVGLCAYLLAAPWLPPSVVDTVLRNERYVSGQLTPGRWKFALAGAVVFGACFWLMRRLRTPGPLRFAVLFLLPMAALPLADDWAGVRLMPQPHRYHIEMELALTLTASLGAKTLLDRVRFRWRRLLAGVLLLLCLYPIPRYRHHARWLARPLDVRTTLEYREAKWLANNVTARRVSMPGSVMFWLNVFTDIPQFGGGFDQGVVNPLWTALHYQVLTGENAGECEGELAVLALRAFGVDAVGVSGPRSSEFYKPFRNPGKFEGLLPAIWREGDDAIYQVPSRSTSLAHVILPRHLPERTPASGLDMDPLRAYIAALEDPSLPEARMRWLNRHTAEIDASLERGQIVSVQITYHPGWSATLSGAPLRLYPDKIGQMVIEPECEGDCRVLLHYNGGPEMILARTAAWIALLGGCAWVLVSWRKRDNKPSRVEAASTS